jgi:hypothetical protein
MWNTTLIYSLFPNTILMMQGDTSSSRASSRRGRVDRAVMEVRSTSVRRNVRRAQPLGQEHAARP